MTLSLLAGSFPQGPLIWKQLSFPEDKKNQLTEIHTDIQVIVNINGKGGGPLYLDPRMYSCDSIILPVIYFTVFYIYALCGVDYNTELSSRMQHEQSTVS